MTTRRISAKAWIALNYAPDCAPNADTVRRWIRRGLISPPPEKHGRSYYFDPRARYTGGADDDLVERVGRDYAAHAPETVTH